jgi:hypothetical protein
MAMMDKPYNTGSHRWILGGTSGSRSVKYPLKRSPPTTPMVDKMRAHPELCVEISHNRSVKNPRSVTT